jgi:hypothetical protein
VRGTHSLEDANGRASQGTKGEKEVRECTHGLCNAEEQIRTRKEGELAMDTHILECAEGGS